MRIGNMVGRSICCSSAVLLFCTVGAVHAKEPAKPLIDGKLSGWQAFHDGGEASLTDVWQVSDGDVLVCRGEPLGYLYTRDSFRDVEFEFEWRWPEGRPPGRGGVLLRMTEDHKIWPKSLEVQLNAGDAGDFWGLAGYGLTGPAEKTKVIEHPKFGKLTNVKKSQPLEQAAGEWNRCRIRLVGDTVKVEINGRAANEATGCDLASGPICLTAEGNGIEFRNVRVAAVK